MSEGALTRQPSSSPPGQAGSGTETWQLFMEAERSFFSVSQKPPRDRGCNSHMCVCVCVFLPTSCDTEDWDEAGGWGGVLFPLPNRMG